MARSHPTVLSITLFALAGSIYADNMDEDFLERQQQSQICQVYTILESPVVIETFVPSNTVLWHPACGCEITVTNAPTSLKTTLTVTSTLNQNAVSTSYENPRYPV